MCNGKGGGLEEPGTYIFVDICCVCSEVQKVLLIRKRYYRGSDKNYDEILQELVCRGRKLSQLDVAQEVHSIYDGKLVAALFPSEYQIAYSVMGKKD